jgi:flagellar hook assembly protein FlgD
MTGIDENAHPLSISLSAFPNPFNPFTTLEFALPESGEASLAVYSLSGQRIRTLVSGKMDAGRHAVVWDGRDDRLRSVSSGVYFARITAGEMTAVRKMLLMR